MKKDLNTNSSQYYYMDDTTGFYKIVKLKTGETILCTMNSDVKSLASETFISITAPVQVIPHKEVRKGGKIISESFLMRPWIGLSDSEEFTLSVDIVMTIGGVKREVKRQYVDYLTHANETRDKIERSDAVDDFLKEITPGELRYVDLDDETNFEGDYYGEEERG